jgi:hypothetical protein
MRIGGLLAAMAAVAALGAGPKPVSQADPLGALRSTLAKALPTPRLYRVTRTSGLTVSAPTLEMCLGAAFLDGLMAGAAPASQDAGAPRKGCTHSYVTRPGGGFHFDLACDRTAGAARTSHMVLDGTVRDLRQSTEMVLEDAASGDARIVSVDLRMTDAGACPAGMAQGQVRRPDSKIMDAPPAGLASGPGRPK